MNCKTIVLKSKIPLKIKMKSHILKRMVQIKGKIKHKDKVAFGLFLSFASLFTFSVKELWKVKGCVK